TGREGRGRLGGLEVPQAVEILEKVAASEPSLAAAAIEAMGRHAAAGGRDSAAANLALRSLQNIVTFDKSSPETKLAAVSALAGSQAGSSWLINQHEQKKLPEARAAEAGRLLRNSPFQPVRNKALLAFPPPGKLDPAKLPSIATLARAHGDAGRGKQILAASVKNEAQCLKCHTVRGVGGQIGPDL